MLTYNKIKYISLCSVKFSLSKLIINIEAQWRIQLGRKYNAAHPKNVGIILVILSVYTVFGSLKMNCKFAIYSSSAPISMANVSYSCCSSKQVAGSHFRNMILRQCLDLYVFPVLHFYNVIIFVSYANGF